MLLLIIARRYSRVCLVASTSIYVPRACRPWGVNHGSPRTDEAAGSESIQTTILYDLRHHVDPTNHRIVDTTIYGPDRIPAYKSKRARPANLPIREHIV